jgi:hypothetical protein
MDARVVVWEVITGLGVGFIMALALEWREYRRSRPTFGRNHRMPHFH